MIRDGYAITVDVLGQPMPTEVVLTGGYCAYMHAVAVLTCRPDVLQVTAWRYERGVIVERFGTRSGAFFPSLAEIEASERIRDNPEGGR